MVSSNVTQLFRTCVQERKSLNRLIPSHLLADKPKPHGRRRCPIIGKCREVAGRITELKDFLVEHRKAYLSLEPDYLQEYSTASMTDKERDKVDGGAQAIIKSSSQLLQDLKRDLYSRDETGQVAETHKAIVDLLENYLKSVTKIFTEMKAIRVKWTVEVQKMSKFEPASPNRVLVDVVGNEEIKAEDRSFEGTTFSTPMTSYKLEDDDAPLSEEELQMFQMENNFLYNELNSLNEEVKSIQSKVVKIAELQEIFTEKVLEQNEDIERISSTLVGTTENLKDANTQIKKAIQNNASFRIYVLFFILVMSFCLLFLDWYND
ncbi:Syntaxin 18 [Nesidiocoris tenuis]|uniref:Syntaxin 18 n=1 Tax=Nesidiocoris tenuis TaxID=355587 RepID=A0ABN7AQZ2_9HEMI|nr:Syntaxin 18 [Nesidiocoris tenuis]